MPAADLPGSLMSTFRVRVVEHRTLGPADSIWRAADYAAILEAAEFPDVGEIPAEELRDMCLLALQDLECHQAAALVLGHHLGGRLKKGQIANLSHELGHEKQWEHHAEMSLHQDFFHVSSLMWEAFPMHYPTPDAVRVVLLIAPGDSEETPPIAMGIDEAMLVRLLADGISPRAMLNRLFEDQLGGGPFPEAPWIVWTFETETEGAGVRVALTGSKAWLEPIRRASPWVSDARSL